jgi:hypothetical protein
MSLRSPTENEIALTPALSQRTGRGSFRSERLLSYLARFRERGKGEGPFLPMSIFSKEVEKGIQQTDIKRSGSQPPAKDRRSILPDCTY